MIISVMEEWPGGHESNLLAYVWIQGICSGEKVRPVLMMLREWGVGRGRVLLSMVLKVPAPASDLVPSVNACFWPLPPPCQHLPAPFHSHFWSLSR